MQDLDKTAMGGRIRQIRLAVGLRQWELARILGTTQSAVHKYEHGVVPEPRRLVELARVGGTSVEWVLTGHHWENGAESRQRLSPELLNTAHLLRGLDEKGRTQLDEALRIVREAVRVLGQEQAGETAPPSPIQAAALEAHSTETLRLLESAWRIQRAVLSQVARDAQDRLDQEPASGDGNGDRPDTV